MLYLYSFPAKSQKERDTYEVPLKTIFCVGFVAINGFAHSLLWSNNHWGNDEELFPLFPYLRNNFLISIFVLLMSVFFYLLLDAKQSKNIPAFIQHGHNVLPFLCLKKLNLKPTQFYVKKTILYSAKNYTAKIILSTAMAFLLKLR